MFESYRMRVVLLAIFFATASSVPAAESGAIDPSEAQAWLAKVDSWVIDGRTSEETVEFMVLLDDQADLEAIGQIADPLDRRRAVVRELREKAEQSQASILSDLKRRGLEHRSLWIANAIWVQGGLADIQRIAASPLVRRVEGNRSTGSVLPTGTALSVRGVGAIEWNVSKIRADDVWALGQTGQGVVIGGQDTGYEWDHAAIQSSYRGWDGVQADHNYNWHDSIHNAGSDCGFDSPVPCDDHNHGTHTMGTMVGDDGGINRIGVAPGAQWIACRNMNEGNGTPLTYSECFQWFIAPTDLNGLNPDPAKAPDVINNSWLCPPIEGCAADTLKVVVSNTRLAGIVVVSSAGNSGSSCGSIADPTATYDEVFSIGATDLNDAIAGFSSRGPVTIDGSNRLKPDVSAPGVNVRSSIRNGGFASLNGTSMAGPHVAATVALMIGANPNLRGRVDDIEEILRRTAIPQTSTQDCGTFSGLTVPNAVFGSGRIDAFAAVTGDPDGDGVGNLADCSPLDPAEWAAPSGETALQLDRVPTGTELSWGPPIQAGSASVEYEVIRGEDPAGFSGLSCLTDGQPNTTIVDDADPTTIYFYLIRARNGCGGHVGEDSGGTPRNLPSCI